MLMIKAENIVKKIKSGNSETELLSGVSLEVENGKAAAIIGKSGCGKTTLMSILSGIDAPTSGKAILNGSDYYSLDVKKQEEFRNNNIGVIFQNYHLIPELTCEENIRMPLVLSKKKISDDEVINVMKMTGIDRQRKLFPRQMSGGEQQRTAIARALVNKPSLIFADEPTGALDAEMGNKVIKFLIASAHKLNLTVLIVTHDMDIAGQCDIIYKMQDKKVQKLPSQQR